MKREANFNLSYLWDRVRWGLKGPPHRTLPMLSVVGYLKTSFCLVCFHVRCGWCGWIAYVVEFVIAPILAVAFWGVMERGLFPSGWQHCLFALPVQQPYCHTNVTSPLCWRMTPTIACQYSVGACGRWDILLSCQSPCKCRYHARRKSVSQVLFRRGTI